MGGKLKGEMESGGPVTCVTTDGLNVAYRRNKQTSILLAVIHKHAFQNPPLRGQFFFVLEETVPWGK